MQIYIFYSSYKPHQPIGRLTADVTGGSHHYAEIAVSSLDMIVSLCRSSEVVTFLTETEVSYIVQTKNLFNLTHSLHFAILFDIQ